MTDPRFIIVGPGALGCGLAGLLGLRGADVALLDYRSERAAAIARDGVRLEGDAGVTVVPVACSAEPAALGVADVVIVLVKAYATAAAVAHVLPCVGPATAVLTLQNGLGNYETLAEHVPAGQVLAGTIVIGCASLGVGHVRLSGTGDIVLGSSFGRAGLAAEVAKALARYWPATRHEPDIDAAIWRKVIVNAAVNPLTALTGLLNGALLEDEALREALRLVAREAAAVATAAGIAAFGGDPAPAVEAVCRLTAGNRSSMLQDVAAGRRTGIEQICGEIVRRGRAVGVATPLNVTLAALVGAQAKRLLEADGEQAAS